jgi:HK97 family phage major capsid protein
MFIFENKNDYLAQRKALLDKVRKFLAEGKTDEANIEMENISAMDEAFEDFAKAQANLNALNGVKPQTSVVPEGVIDSMNDKKIAEDLYASMDYRKAFMNHVLKGEAIPAAFSNDVTKTSDVGVVIPTTVLERIIEKLENVGTIYNLVTRTAYKGGLSIPTNNVKPVASWVAEGATSSKQKQPVNGTITFAYHKLRCAVAVTLETDTMSIAAFETMLINNVSKAMIKAIEEAIINGDGNGKPEGILANNAPEGQAIAVDSDEKLSYKTLTDVEGAIPEEYENNAAWCMSKKTFMSFAGMTDQNGQPIARVNFGINGKPERTLLGRPVVISKNVPSYSDSVDEDILFAFVFNFEDYTLNMNLNITIKQYEDNETDDKITKAVALVDGKVTDINSLVTLTKKA